MNTENKKRKYTVCTKTEDGKLEKWCSECNISLSINHFYTVRISSKGVQYYSSLCKDHNAKKYNKTDEKRRKAVYEMDENGMKLKQCNGICQAFLPLSKFHKRETCCRTCFKQRKHLSMSSRLLVCLHTARDASNARRKKGRELAGQYDLTLPFLEQKLQEQKGLCAYSGMVLQYTGEDFVVSIERMDTSLGEIKTNVCLIAREFNTTDYTKRHKITQLPKETLQGSTWSKEKFYAIKNLFFLPMTQKEQTWIETEVKNIKNIKHQSRWKRKKEQTETGEILYECKDCKNMFPISKKKKTSTASLFCSFCLRKRGNTLKGRCNILANAAKTRDQLKRMKFKIKNPQEVTLTFQDVIELYCKQSGRCAYSGIKMDLQSYKNWQISLERLDNNRLHTRDNCVLICLEFQTGHTQWSSKKVQKVWNLEHDPSNLIFNNVSAEKNEALI